MQNFDTYLIQFERLVIAGGIDQGCLGRKETVSIRNGRLSMTPFARKMGREVSNDQQFAVDYYGYMKKSAGLLDQISVMQSEFQEAGKQLKGVVVPVVHFAAIRVEKIARLAPGLVAEFPMFKKEILDARGFKHQYEI